MTTMPQQQQQSNQNNHDDDDEKSDNNNKKPAIVSRVMSVQDECCTFDMDAIDYTILKSRHKKTITTTTATTMASTDTTPSTSLTASGALATTKTKKTLLPLMELYTDSTKTTTCSQTIIDTKAQQQPPHELKQPQQEQQNETNDIIVSLQQTTINGTSSTANNNSNNNNVKDGIHPTNDTTTSTTSSTTSNNNEKSVVGDDTAPNSGRYNAYKKQKEVVIEEVPKEEEDETIPATRIPKTIDEQIHRIKLGICAMDKKARSKPMAEILCRLDPNLFYVIFFGDDTILNQPIETWPVCDVIIAFFSKGYPINKVKQYVELHKPLQLNDLDKQILLQDRRCIYDHLESAGIDVPRHVYLSRDGYVSTGTGDGNSSSIIDKNVIYEYDDHIELNGVSIHKPFVEKPVYAEDHNICIYYPTSAGGGCKKLFRKIGNRSSEFYPNINEIRSTTDTNSYIYEEFVETQGTDVKMYSVGPEYGHAEARKSPAVDGKVERNVDGKEVRFPVILTFREKEISRRIVLIFKQFVCGFDILRVQDHTNEHYTSHFVSYVCDVNGWSFVKNSRKYFDDCSQIISEHIVCSIKPTEHKFFSTLDPLVMTSSTNSINRESGASLALAAARNIRHNEEERKKRNQEIHRQQLYDTTTSTGTGTGTGTTGTIIETTMESCGESWSVMTTTTSSSNNVATTLVEGALPVRDFPHNLTMEPPPISGSANCPSSSLSSSYNATDITTSNTTTTDKNTGICAATVGGAYSTRDNRNNNNKTNTPNNMVAFNHSNSTNSTNSRLLADKKRSDSFASNTSAPHQEELRCVIAIVRHGDRTPKQKLKLNLKEPHILRYFHEHSKDCTKELKVKSKAPLTEFYEMLKLTLSELPNTIDTDEDTKKLRYHLLHMRDILERWKIVGLNRKIQLKPIQFESIHTVEAVAAPPPTTNTTTNTTTDPTSGAGIETKQQQQPQLLCTEVQLILKWGGNLTKLGEKQSIQLGQRFRYDMYPDSLLGGGTGTGGSIGAGNSSNTSSKNRGTGILRLHSTFRHDLKIRTSDEGRVMKTAAAFAKGMLELEGDLPPILVSLVHKEKGSLHMLDPSGNSLVKKELEHCKETISKQLQRNINIATAAEKELYELVGSADFTSLRRTIVQIGNPRHVLDKIYTIMGQLMVHLDELLANSLSGDEATASSETNNGNSPGNNGGNGGNGNSVTSNGNTGGGGSGGGGGDVALCGVKLYKGETLLELTERWRFIYHRLYDEKHDRYDMSKIPDILDNVRFDMIHNPHLGYTIETTFHTLYDVAKLMADCVVPQEYGSTVFEKRSVGVKICHSLLEKIQYDLRVARNDNEVDMRYMINMEYAADLPINTMGRRIRTRLYFTSESHLHTVINVLRFGFPTTTTTTNTTTELTTTESTTTLLSKEGLQVLNDTPELCYLTHIVFRVFEDNNVHPPPPPRNSKNNSSSSTVAPNENENARRFRVEILFSPGVNHTPTIMNHALTTSSSNASSSTSTTTAATTTKYKRLIHDNNNSSDSCYNNYYENDPSRLDTAELVVISRADLTCQEVEDFFDKAIVEGTTTSAMK